MRLADCDTPQLVLRELRKAIEVFGSAGIELEAAGDSRARFWLLALRCFQEDVTFLAAAAYPPGPGEPVDE